MVMLSSATQFLFKFHLETSFLPNNIYFLKLTNGKVAHAQSCLEKASLSVKGIFWASFFLSPSEAHDYNKTHFQLDIFVGFISSQIKHLLK